MDNYTQTEIINVYDTMGISTQAEREKFLQWSQPNTSQPRNGVDFLTVTSTSSIAYAKLERDIKRD